jgi:hypothetical protein
VSRWCLDRRQPACSAGIPTATPLRPGGAVDILYLFGLAAVPPGFGAGASIDEDNRGVPIADAYGKEVFARLRRELRH